MIKNHSEIYYIIQCDNNSYSENKKKRLLLHVLHCIVCSIKMIKLTFYLQKYFLEKIKCQKKEQKPGLIPSGR